MFPCINIIIPKYSCPFVVLPLPQGAPTRAIPALPSPPSSLLPMKKYSCPFVCIRGSYLSVISCLSCFSWFIFFPSFRAFRAFRGSNFFFVSIRVHSWFKFFFVSIRVHSWFIFSPSLRVHSWPRRTTSAIKKQTRHPRKIIKKVYISTCYSRTSFPYGTSWSP